MSEIKPVPEAKLPDSATKDGLPGRLFFDPSFSPASPKIREFQARHEALRTVENEPAHLLAFG